MSYRGAAAPVCTTVAPPHKINESFIFNQSLNYFDGVGVYPLDELFYSEDKILGAVAEAEVVLENEKDLEKEKTHEEQMDTVEGENIQTGSSGTGLHEEQMETETNAKAAKANVNIGHKLDAKIAKEVGNIAYGEWIYKDTFIFIVISFFLRSRRTI